MRKDFYCIREGHHTRYGAKVCPDVMLEGELEAEQRPLLLCGGEDLELAELRCCAGRHLNDNSPLEAPLRALPRVCPDE